MTELEKELRWGKNFSLMQQELREEAKRQERAAAAGYANRQKQICDHNKDMKDGYIKGFGRKVASIDAVSYFKNIAINRDFFRDKANWKDLQMKNPELFLKNYV